MLTSIDEVWVCKVSEFCSFQFRVTLIHFFSFVRVGKKVWS